jgi:hypothetical protein
MVQGTDRLETSPFDVQDLKKMVGAEFCLLVLGYTMRDKSDQRRIANCLSPETRDGLLGEMIERKPGSCLYYQLGELTQVLLPDGIPLGTLIDRVMQEYLFYLEEVRIEDGKPPVLVGSVRPFFISSNHVETQLEQKITLHMAKLPTEKIKSGLCTA